MSFLQEPLLPPTPTRKGVTYMVFLSLDFSARHSQFAPISQIHSWEAESSILDHQDSPSSQFLLGPTGEATAETWRQGEERSWTCPPHPLFAGVSVLRGGSFSGGPNCSCLAWVHLASSNIIPATFSVPFTGLVTLPPSKMPFH